MRETMILERTEHQEWAWVWISFSRPRKYTNLNGFL